MNEFAWENIDNLEMVVEVVSRN